MATLNQLHSFENNAKVRDILYSYFNVNSDEDLLNILNKENNDLVSYWSDSCKIRKSNLIDWIEASLDDSAKFKVTKDATSKKPEYKLDLDAGIILMLDWVIED